MNKCEICKKEIKIDSQYINGKWYHNECIETLQQRIDKAIEYIEMICELGSYSKSCNLDSEEINELLSILKGE